MCGQCLRRRHRARPLPLHTPLSPDRRCQVGAALACRHCDRAFHTLCLADPALETSDLALSAGWTCPACSGSNAVRLPEPAAHGACMAQVATRLDPGCAAFAAAFAAARGQGLSLSMQIGCDAWIGRLGSGREAEVQVPPPREEGDASQLERMGLTPDWIIEVSRSRLFAPLAAPPPPLPGGACRT